MSAADVDLNLLRVLDALLSEGSVAGAAERLHLSAPAVSRSLGRLRRSLDDPLFVRAGRSLVPTPRAVELRADVRAALDAAVEALLPSPDVDPANLQRRFVISARDVLVARVGIALLPLIEAQAPGVDIAFMPDTNELDLLRNGDTDLDLGDSPGVTSDLESEALFEDRFVIVVRRGHTLAERPITLERYAAAHHLSVSQRARGRGPVDDALATRGLARDRITTVPSAVAAVHMVAVTDLVALVPTSVVQAFDNLDVVAIDLPLAAPPVTISQTWHKRHTADPAHQWLRRLIRSATTTPRPLRFGVRPPE